MYQKIGAPSDEELLEEYFCEDRNDRVQLPQHYYRKSGAASAGGEDAAGAHSLVGINQMSLNL